MCAVRIHPILSFLPFVVAFGFAPTLSADCPPAPTAYPNGAVEGVVAEDGCNSAVAADSQGRFAVVFQEAPIPFMGNRLLIHRFNADGSCICNQGDACPAQLSAGGPTAHRSASIAIAKLGDPPVPTAIVGWIGTSNPPPSNGDWLLRSAFPPFPPSGLSPDPQGIPRGPGPADATPSVTINANGETGTAWRSETGGPSGLVFDPGGGLGGARRLGPVVGLLRPDGPGGRLPDQADRLGPRPAAARARVIALAA